MEIQQVLIDELKPWDKNPRINDSAVDAVAKSIHTFGFNVPILYDQHMTIVAGHVRWKAAKQLGLTTVPAIQLSLTRAQREAFAVADNKTGEMADWDYDVLGEILKELPEEGIDLGSLGFSEGELDAILKPEKDFNWDQFQGRPRRVSSGCDPCLLARQGAYRHEAGCERSDSSMRERADNCREGQLAIGGACSDVAFGDIAVQKPLEAKVHETVQYLRLFGRDSKANTDSSPFPQAKTASP